MATVSEALIVLFPNATPDQDYIVRDDGSGPFIAYWDPALGVEPTPAEMDAVTPAQVTATRKTKEANIHDFLDRLEARQAAIDADITLTQSSPTLNQLTRVVRDMLQFEQRELRTLERSLAIQGIQKLT